MPTNPQPPKRLCPHCGAELSEAIGILIDRKPEWGDVSICAYCSGVNIFQADLSLRRANPGELAELGPITQGVIHAIKSNQAEQRAPLQ